MNNDSVLVNRMTVAKDLPTLSGHPFEWFRFKQAYDWATKLRSYSDRENVLRLFEALKGDAGEAVELLLAINIDDPNSKIRTLELSFGKKYTLPRKIVSGFTRHS